MNQAEILKKKVPNLNKARSPLKNVNSDMQYGLTHASVRNSKDDFFPLSDDLIDAIVARKPFVQYSWVEDFFSLSSLAIIDYFCYSFRKEEIEKKHEYANCRKNVCTEIPSYSSHAPKLILEGVPAKVVDPLSRECCLKGYVFLLEPENKENAGDAVDIGGKNSI